MSGIMIIDILVVAISLNPYRKVYMIPSDAPIAEKLYIIDDGDHSTMLLSSEY